MIARLFAVAFALAALLVGPAMAAEDIVFTGEVTYRERMALPPDAELTVTLVTQADQRKVVGASAVISAQGGVPLQFTLRVRTNSVNTDRRYGLLAEISSHGQVWFRNLEMAEVDAGAPQPVRILVQRTNEPQPVIEQVLPVAALLDTQWSVTRIGEQGLVDKSAISFAVAADGRVSGRACNNYFAEAQIGAEALEFGPIAGTRMACEPALMSQENLYFQALAQAKGYQITEGQLALSDANGVTLVTLARATTP
jgi:putative lipoprotein